ncbi:MAG TPA: penicillin acylase family protein, partial [Candidatus Acidoferrales bacterium]|nr:penicillin acylase family protein [Candidatus Acidoferrales bacterium]
MRGLALLLLQLVAVATSTQALPARARTRSGPPLVAVAPAVAPPRSELLRWRREASRVTIVRDDWGIAHVQGHSDADAVFGMEYAQAEDDFDRVETNYLAALGRLSEAEGPSAIARDLRARLDVDDDSLRALYRSSPAWLRSLMDSFADGLNFYLATHPAVTPRAIRHFEPWMALSFTEGSIGGDVERIDLDSLAAFYGAGDPGAVPHARGDGDDVLREPEGSNGIAIAPALTRDGHALLWINPHTSFYFRSELQVSSDEGLDAYGAVTWGQFFVYQGFNRTAGWMHTSSGVDAVDEFLETVSPRGRGYVSRHGDREEPVASRRISIRCLTPEGLAPRRFTAYFTRHGPVVRRQGARWVSVRLMHDPVHALMQSFLRTKAANLAGFRRSLELHANSSNNTVFADAQGHIAYFHANWIPRRDTSFDWTQPVDGSDPRTDGRGVLAVDESPNVVDPASGWLYNSNNWPWSAAGPSSPRRADFPRYVETGVEETPRGEHALHLLAGARDWTMDGLTAAAFDSELPAFQHMVPALVAAWEALPATDARRAALAGPVDTLRAWNERWGEGSVATSLAVFWGECAARRA